MIKVKDEKLVRLAWPIFIELLLVMLLGNVDQIMISRYSQISVAAVGNANQIINVLIIFLNVLSTASIILITQYKGANKEEELTKMYSMAVYLNLGISVILSVFIFTCIDLVLNMLSVPREVMPEAKKYLTLIGGFMFLQGLMLTYSAFLKSSHLTKQSMMVNVITNIINIFGNLLLINGVGNIPPLGVTGIAISTTVSKAIGVVLMRYMYKRHIGVPIKVALLKPFPFKLFKQTMRVGIASAGFSFSYNLSQMAILGIINLFGTYSINTKIYISILVMLTYLLAVAISNATQIIIGNLLGAGKLEEAKSKTWYSIRISMISCLIISVLTYVLSEPLFHIFTMNEEIITLGKTILLIDIVLEQGRAANISLLQSLQVAADNGFLVTVTVLSTWIIAVIGGYLFAVSFGLGLVGIWIAMTIDEVTRAFICALRWKSGMWQKKRILIGNADVVMSVDE